MENTIDEELVDDVMILAEEEEVVNEEGNKEKRMCFRGELSRADSLNANHRVYPKEVLREVYKEAIERSKKSQRPIFGEIEHACYTYDTFKVLTKKGYKSFKKIKIGDEVASASFCGKLEYKPVSAIINDPYKGNVYNITGEGIDATVTPNHKLFLKNSSKILVISAEDLYNDIQNYADCYFMKLDGEQIKESISVKNISIARKWYEGNIYCITVSENHNFFIKDNGTEYLTGNSNSHINLERIAVTFPEFTWNEEKGIIEGKAVPTLTKAGETVRGLAKSGFPICFSTRMSGKVKPLTEERKKQFNITEDYANCVEVLPGAKLISVDVVGDPSDRSAIGKVVMEQKEEEKEDTRPTFKQVFDAMF